MRWLLCATILCFGQNADAPLRFESTPSGQHVVARLPADVAAKLGAGRLTQEQGEAILALSLLADDTKSPGPSMLGRYDRAGSELTFTPRFPLNAGATYRASLKIAGKTSSLDHTVPAPEAKAPPRVVKIYPTAD